MAADIPNLQITVDASDLDNRDEGINQVLAELRKDWRPEDVKIKNLGEFAGLTNRTFVCYVTDDMADGVVFRLPNQHYSKYFDVDKSTRMFFLMNDIGVGPRVLCRLLNGFCYEYVQGRTFSAKNTYECRDLTLGKLVARELAKIHSKKSIRLAQEKYDLQPENFSWKVFDTVIADWKEDMPPADEEAKKLFYSPAFPKKEEFLKEKKFMDDVIGRLGFPLVISHNDAYFGNVIYNEEKGKATIVDYDVCYYNNQGFDIAEFPLTGAFGFLAIDRKGESRTLNTPEYYREFLKSYLETLSVQDEWGRDVTEKDIERLYAQVCKMTLFNMLYLIAICVLISGKPGPPGHGPLQAVQAGADIWRLYLEMKEETLALEIPSSD